MATVTVSANGTTVTLSANPTSVVSGGASLLTASATNATQVVITGTHLQQLYARRDGWDADSKSGSDDYLYSDGEWHGWQRDGHGYGDGDSQSSNSDTEGESHVYFVRWIVGIDCERDKCDPGSHYRNRWEQLYARRHGRHTDSNSGGDNYLYSGRESGASGNATAAATVTVISGAGPQSISHVIFMLQENHSFDEYFGMLNPYRAANNWSIGDDGNTYSVDGIDDKLGKISNMSDEGTSYPLFKFTSSCVEDETSSWLESYGDVNR